MMKTRLLSLALSAAFVAATPVAFAQGAAPAAVATKAANPSRMSCVHTTYTPAVTTQPASANRQPTVFPTAIATAIPSTTAIDIRTATVSRNNLTRGFTIKHSQSVHSTQRALC